MHDPEAYRLLYEDEEGVPVGLDQVMLLSPAPLDRVPTLKPLLEAEDQYVAFQAAMVLAAWGVDAGVLHLEGMIDHADPQAEPLMPHRIRGYENCYDLMADAVDCYEMNGGAPEVAIRIYGKLLALYGHFDFECALKDVLLNGHHRELIDLIERAFRRALGKSKIYLASQLLPLLAAWAPKTFWNLLPQIERRVGGTPDPANNIAEALGHIHTKESIDRLEALARDPKAVVANEAKAALAKARAD